MPNGRCTECGAWDIDYLHECPPKNNQKVLFEKIAEGCPMKDWRKCTAINDTADKQYGNCIIENCAFVYWLRATGNRCI